MPYLPNITEFQETNSTTYVDVLGLQIGLDRLPGESSTNYLKRIELAARVNRQHPYEGMINEVNLQLGFQPDTYISIQVPSDTVVTVSIAGVVVGTQQVVPIVTFDDDTMWSWRTLSDVVADLNALYPTSLLVSDGPAFQLARQSNSNWSFSENIGGLRTQLSHSGVQVGTELFNQSVPPYTLTSDGLLIFTIEPDSGTTITYNYVTTPCIIVGTPVVAIGLKDPEFVNVANAPDGSLAYQIREFLQAVMLIDRSYWAE